MPTISKRLVCLSLSLPMLLMLLMLFYQQRRGDESSTHQKRRLAATKVDLYFLGFPLTFHKQLSTSFESTVHCVGENFETDAWMYRSCQFRNLCLDVKSNEFLFLPSREELDLQDMLDQLQSEWISISSVSRNSNGVQSMSLGTIRETESHNGKRLPWFPRVVLDPAEQRQIFARGFFRLPENATFFPFEPSLTKQDSWSDCFSIYTVLSIFGLDNLRPAFVNMGETNKNDNFPPEFLPIFGSQPASDTSMDWRSSWFERPNEQSDIICAAYGAAGIGMLANTHRSASDGSNKDTILTHTIGRGAALYSFRQFMIRNLDLVETLTGSVLVTVDMGTNEEKRNWSSQIQQHLQLSGLRNETIRSVEAGSLSIKEIALVATSSKVYIAQLGDEMTMAAATFLPRGSTIIILDEPVPTSGLSRQLSERFYLENAGYFHVHVIGSQTTSQEKATLEEILAVVRSAVDRV